MRRNSVPELEISCKTLRVKGSPSRSCMRLSELAVRRGAVARESQDVSRASTTATNIGAMTQSRDMRRASSGSSESCWR